MSVSLPSPRPGKQAPLIAYRCMKASSITLGSDYEVQLGHFGWSRARATIVSKHAPGMWDCLIVKDKLNTSSVAHGTRRIVASRNVVRPWEQAVEQHKTQAAVDRAWEKANNDTRNEVDSLLNLIAPHLRVSRDFIDIDFDSSGLPGEVTVTLDVPLPELRRLAAILEPESCAAGSSISPLSELISA